MPHQASRLAVLSGQVVDAAGGRFATECGVSAVMVVHVQPWVKGGAAFGFGGVGPGVGPFVGQGAVVALDFAVGLGPVGAGALGGDAQGGARGGPQPGAGAQAGVAQGPPRWASPAGAPRGGAGAAPRGW